MATQTVTPQAQSHDDNINAAGAVTEFRYEADGKQTEMTGRTAGVAFGPVSFSLDDVPSLNQANLKAEMDKIRNYAISLHKTAVEG